MSTEKKPRIDLKDLKILMEGEIENYQVPCEIFGYGNSLLIAVKVDPLW